MKKKVISALLATTLVAGMLVGCGSKEAADAPAKDAAATEEKTEEKAEEKTEDAAAAEDTAAATEEGKVFNIQVWNEEFKSRITDHYPGYEAVDGTTGKIGDVTVKWTVTPSDDNAYQNNLDEMLLKQADAAADDKVDMFLIEADYALKYVNSDYAMKIADLGITEDELKDQYQYTKDIVTDGNGDLKGVSWQGCPGVFIYNRAAAKEVLGSDDPQTVQEAVKDWDTFLATAAKMKDAGYKMCSSANDTYRVFSNNVTSKWVEDGKINIDENIKAWAEMSKEMVDKGQAGTHDLWGDDWSKGFYPDGKVFCYFGPAWFVDFSMAADVEGSIANQGGWGATEGPQGFFWGGTWICAATGTDNASLVADVIRQLCCNTDIMLDIVKDDNDFVNNVPAMTQMAADTSYQSKVLGGQNPLAMYCAGAGNIDLSNTSPYDQGCNEEFQNAMKNWYEGSYATYEEAVEAFQKAVVEKYPELTY
ncbi:MAG: ABC transporter substrate-binding protein [Eubacterium sp.]|nr:ABC transporter substrate-binding protein [Eubacterium sp.]